MSEQEQEKPKVKAPRGPSYDLEESIEIVGLIFGKEQHNSMDVKTIGQHIGMKPTGGTFLAKMAAVSYYGLIDRVGKADSRVSDLAKTILLSNSDQERRRALIDALRRPKLFASLCDEFASTGLPTEANLANRLIRDGLGAAKGSRVAHVFIKSAKYAHFGDEEVADTPRLETESRSQNVTSDESRTCVQEIPLGEGRRAVLRIPDDITLDDIEKIGRVLKALYA